MIWWFSAFAIIQALDVVTTRIGLDRGLIEANPIMRGAVGSLGLLIMLKLVAVVAAGCLVRFGFSGKLRIVAWSAVIIVSAVPVINNAIRLWV